jgi:hypothetical protein
MSFKAIFARHSNITASIDTLLSSNCSECLQMIQNETLSWGFLVQGAWKSQGAKYDV